ncbi:MAG: lytic transglycosylase domain-containing protein [Acidobacteriota bacterium]|jgi:hypothetical protein
MPEVPRTPGRNHLVAAGKPGSAAGKARPARRAFIVVAMICLYSPGLLTPAAAQYLAVFTDGRVLAVTGASLLDDRTVRLELPGGGRLELPARRLEAVVEALVEPEPEPVARPTCSADWEEHPLPEGTPFAAEIEAAARAAGLHPWLVAAVVEAESRYDPRAVSRVGARGLMQLMPSVWIPAGLANPHDVKANLRVGSAYLKRLHQRFGELPLALAAYNAGPTTVERYGGIPPYRETRSYLQRILSRFCPGQEGEGL